MIEDRSCEMHEIFKSCYDNLSEIDYESDNDISENYIEEESLKSI